MFLNLVMIALMLISNNKLEFRILKSKTFAIIKKKAFFKI